MKKQKICMDCETRPATWKLYYRKHYQWDYNIKAVFYCDDCMFGALEGVHTGGGETIDWFKKIVRIHKDYLDKKRIKVI